MEYNTPSSYKNYLPSKKIQIIIGILLLIGIGYFTLPSLVTLIKKTTLDTKTKPSLIVGLPTGDPTTRDTDRDGVPDWQEIAIGLDSNNPQTKPGAPDLTTFETIKNQVGESAFNLEASKVTDTDKVSLTIYDALAKDSVKNNGISVQTTQAVTAQELYNYIAAQKKLITVYSAADIQTVPDSLTANQVYAKKMKTILADTPATKDAPAKISTYLEGTSGKETVQPALVSLQGKIKEMKAVSVPVSAQKIHLDLLNALQGVYQVVDSYNPTANDPTVQVSATSLTQDYLIIAAKNTGYLSMYFSVALNPQGYVSK